MERTLAIGHTDALHFLNAWQAWRLDTQRPRLLHYVWIVADPAAVALAAPEPLQALAQTLAAQWPDVSAGFHRLVFDDGQVLLTVCVGEMQAMLQAQQFEADAVWLDATTTPWDSFGIKALARCCQRGARLEAHCPPNDDVRLADLLAQQGFAVQPPDMPGLLVANFDPPWQLRQRTTPTASPLPAGRRCAVVGAGLAGASVAASLARRGWQVTVLDAGAQPAAGASGVPVALLAPRLTADGGYLSRLSCAGVQATLQQARSLLREGEDWAETGVLEHRRATPSNAGTPTLWHPQAGWVKPARLVQALLDSPRIVWQGNDPVEQIERSPTGWRVRGQSGALLTEADLVVVAAGVASRTLLGQELPLQPVRGQMSWQLHGAPGTPSDPALFPAFPLNGAGSLAARIPTDNGPAWFTGATFERGQLHPEVSESGHQANLQRLQKLVPALADALTQQYVTQPMQGWSGVRCATPDRLPLVGPLGGAQDSPWICTGLGSRGLTWAVLCGELLAARLHGEPLPLERKLAAALDTQRFMR